MKVIIMVAIVILVFAMIIGIAIASLISSECDDIEYEGVARAERYADEFMKSIDDK